MRAHRFPITLGVYAILRSVTSALAGVREITLDPKLSRDAACHAIKHLCPHCAGRIDIAKLYEMRLIDNFTALGVFGARNRMVDLRALALPVFAGLMLVEVVLSARRGKLAYELADFLGSMSQLAGNILVQLAVNGLILGFYFGLYQFRIFTFDTSIEQLILLAIVLDFLYYWYHRASHRVRLLWAVHVAHHSSEHMNLGTALRQSWFGPLTKPLFYWPVPLLGFDPIMIMSVGSLLTIYGFWTHTEQIKRIGWLEHVFVSPAHHRVHHGSNPQYIDRNFSNFLIIWDKIFRTFEAERQPVNYGLTNNIKTYNPFRIALHEWSAMFAELARANSLSDRLRLIFSPPDDRSRPICPSPLDIEKNRQFVTSKQSFDS